MVPLGGDFTYQNAFENFDNTGRFIEYFNKKYGQEFQIEYSTPSKYLDAIIAANFTLPVTYTDIVPYADIPNSFWTGYYTSRPNLKKYVRDGSHNLHASNELYAMRVID